MSVLLLASHNVTFAENRYTNFGKDPVDFSLSFSNVDFDLHSGDKTYPANQRRISLSIFNTLDPHVQYGLLIGSSNLSMKNDAATAGLRLNGQHIGFAMRGFIGNNPRLGLQAEYLFQEAKDENQQHSSTLTWHQWLVEASIQLKFNSYWAVSAGGGLAGINADRRVSGDINETLGMKLDTGPQGHIEINLFDQSNGRVSLLLQRGVSTGTSFNFSRAFY